MPAIDTAVFQLSALALLGLILVAAVIALFRLGSLKRALKRALKERPSATAADVVPFAGPEGRPAETQEETAAAARPPAERAEEPAEGRGEPAPEGRTEEAAAEPARTPTEAEREQASPPPDEAAASEEREPDRTGLEPEAEAAALAAAAEQRVTEAPATEAVERGEPELVRETPAGEDAAAEATELQPESVAAEAPEEEAEGAAAPVGWQGPDELRAAAAMREEDLEPESAGVWEVLAEGRDERETVGVGREEPQEVVEAAGEPRPAPGDAEAPAEVGGAPSTVSAQQQQVAAGAEAESEFVAERTWDDVSQQTEAATGEPATPEPEGALTAAWAYDWARQMPEEQPIERDGRWWFKRGGELLLYDETTAQWVPAPMPESPAGDEPAANSNGVEFGGAAATTQSSFWKCPSCGAVNGSTASTCRMCFAARP